jgi:hypothetical protein
MNARIDRSSVHSVRVQNARWASLNRETARFPDAFFAARAERSEPSKNAGKNRNDRTRSRVIETGGMA